MGRREDILARLRAALQLSDPEWDAAPGTPEYKILEAVAQELDSVTYDSVLSDYGFDINKKSGLELDAFVGMFGFTRVSARRATGFVTFSRGVAADVDYSIPSGTQVAVPATAVAPAVVFQTTATVVLATGASQVEVPVEAVVSGTTGNVAAGAIKAILSVLTGITAVVNDGPATGGSDGESDADLRARWRTTVFRNLSGTEDQFLALAFNEDEVVQANVVGASERFTEQLQVPSVEAGGWAQNASAPTGQTLRGLAYSSGDSAFVAVGDAGTIIASSDAGVSSSWSAKSSGTVEQLVGVRYHSSPDLFVAVGNNTLLHSKDGSSWSSSTTGANTYLRDSAYDGSIVVVVGDSGTILTSTWSGSAFGAWTSQTSGTTLGLRGITYASSLDLFVAVGQGGTILTSPDGLPSGLGWTPRTSATSAELRSVEWSSVFGLFVAVGAGGTIITSPDGVSWTSRNSNVSSDINQVVWVGTPKNTLVAPLTSGNVLVSTDGVNWDQSSTGSASALYAGAYGASSFVVVGGAGGVFTSTKPRSSSTYTVRSQVPDSKYTFPDGSEFLSRYAGTTQERMAYPGLDYTYTPSSVAPFQPSVQILDTDDFPAGAVLDFQHEYTPDSSRNDPANGVVDKVEMFVSGERPTNALEEVKMSASTAFTFGAPGVVQGTTATSIEADSLADASGTSVSPAVIANSDGWTKRASGAETTTLYDAAFNAAGTTAVVVGTASGSVSGIRYSSTSPFTSWSNATGTYTGTWAGIDFHSSGNFLALGPTGTVAYGTTGSSWTTATTGAGAALRKSVYDGSAYVAVGESGKMVRSTNLSSWTVITSGTSQDLNGIAYASDRYVAVGRTGTITFSSNGTAWATVAPVTAKDLYSVAYSPELDLFAAVGASNTVLVSQNGTAWSAKSPSGSVSNLRDVVWASGLSLFVATTEGKRVYTSPDGATWTLGSATLDEYGNRVAYNATTGNLITVGANGYVGTAKAPAFPASATLSSDRSLAATTGEIKTAGQTPGANSVRVDFYAYRKPSGTASNGAPTVTLGVYDEASPASPAYSTSVPLSIGGWVPRSSLTGTVNSVVYGRGIYVAVGNSGKIWTSTSYTGPWTERTSGTTADLKGVTYGKDSGGVGTFVAVGALSGTGAVILTSTAPTTTWTSRTVPTNSSTLSLNAVAASNGGAFAAVGSGGAVRYTTGSLSSWSSATAGSAALNGVAYSTGISTFVAVGASGAMYSATTPATWTSRTSGFSTTDINAVATDGAATASTWVLVGNAGKVGVGTTIGGTVTVTTPLSGSGNPNLYTVASGMSGSWFVGGASAYALAGSPAGTWSSVSLGLGTGNAIRASLRGPDGWTAMGESGAYSTAVPSTSSSKVGSLNFTATAGKTYTYRVKWASGTGFEPVVDKVVVTVANPLGTSTTSTAYGVALGNFLRDDGFSRPASGNYFMRLFKTPVLTVPDELTVGSKTYTKGVDYWLVRDDTLLRGSTRGKEGVEWRASSAPDDGALVSVPYSYNALVERIHEQVNLVRLVGTDVLVHEGRKMRTRLNLALVVQRGYSTDTVKSQLETVLTSWLASKSFRNDIQIADLYDKVYTVRGVENVRLVQGAEARDAVQRVVMEGADSGTFRLTFLGATTADIAWNADTSTVQTALAALPTVGSGNVSVSGTAGEWVVTFQAALGQRPVPLMADSYGSTAHNGDMSVSEDLSGIGHGIQFVAENGLGILATNTSDVYMKSDQIPVFHDLTVLPRAQNTF